MKISIINSRHGILKLIDIFKGHVINHKIWKLMSNHITTPFWVDNHTYSLATVTDHI